MLTADRSRRGESVSVDTVDAGGGELPVAKPGTGERDAIAGADIAEVDAAGAAVDTSHVDDNHAATVVVAEVQHSGAVVDAIHDAAQAVVVGAVAVRADHAIADAGIAVVVVAVVVVVGIGVVRVTGPAEGIDIDRAVPENPAETKVQADTDMPAEEVRLRDRVREGAAAEPDAIAAAVELVTIDAAEHGHAAVAAVNRVVILLARAAGVEGTIVVTVIPAVRVIAAVGAAVIPAALVEAAVGAAVIPAALVEAVVGVAVRPAALVEAAAGVTVIPATLVEAAVGVAVRPAALVEAAAGVTVKPAT